MIAFSPLARIIYEAISSPRTVLPVSLFVAAHYFSRQTVVLCREAYSYCRPDATASPRHLPMHAYQLLLYRVRAVKRIQHADDL